ncbi:MAG: pyridoxal phosphate-dependent aminotransferase [Nitrospinaceae bacterium]|nr:aspartate aminotransferase [Nitrospinota bacterium]MDP7147469.1 pyridoxal phosphate-dependent aminotransferase [Nitrospinaceae bacterium]|tara:strand:- start:9464 stop:10657 length:1194 start_codon:yes stop_codon:yes gene_type:complete
MKFSKRIQSIRPSMTLAVDAKARELKANGVDVIGFGAGEPDFNTPDIIKRAGVEAIEQNETHYTPAGGTVALKQAIIDKLKRDNDLDYEKNQILVSCGAKHSFFNLAQVLWEEGDEIIVPAPYWVSYPDIIRYAGALPVIIDTLGENQFKITPDQIQSAVTPNTRAIILNSPSNPTGSAYTKKELEAIAECALRNGLLVVSDEIYEKIVFDGFEQSSICSLGKEVQDNCVLINGVSKSYAMTGWRIGYLAANAEIIKQTVKLQGQSTSNPTSVSQVASIAALNKGEADVQRMVIEFQKRRNTLVDSLLSIPGVECYKPVGSFYTFPDFSAFYGKTFKGKKMEGSIQLAEFLLAEGKVAMVPGIAFGADKNLRMAFASSMDTIKQGVDRIIKTLALLE